MQPCVPQTLPLNTLNWDELIPCLGPANRALARYDGILQSLPNADILLAPFTTREAVLSSRIEGTQATLEEVLKYEARPAKDTPHVEDIREVINYRQALSAAVTELQQRPLSLNMIRRAHALLLKDVRGQHRMPGEFRRVQNWIGPPGSSLKNARFVPPSPAGLPNALDNFEKYLHYREKDRLGQMAILHAQFEIIHPFLDGNGRLGRMLIPLFLFEKQVIHQPVFYMSAFFEKNRQAYYDNLLLVTENNAWEKWIIFFLQAMEQQGKENSEKAKNVLELHGRMKEEIVSITRSQYAIRIIDYLFSFPVFQSAHFQQETAIPKASANRLLNQLLEAGVIRLLEQSKGRRANIFIFGKLLEIINR
jgi:Fic family protein